MLRRRQKRIVRLTALVFRFPCFALVFFDFRLPLRRLKFISDIRHQPHLVGALQLLQWSEIPG